MYCYIHIPFCSSKCKYCRFASVWTFQNTMINKYVLWLLESIYNYDNIIDNNKIRTLYFWWWTPSVLNKENLEKIFKALKSKFIFDENIEISIESTPIEITIEKLQIWKDLWINRLSIWIQTFNKKSLNTIWRDIIIPIFPKDVNDFNLSFDFIIGLPFVKKWEILEDIKKAISMYDLKHISCYMLEDYYSKEKIIETKYDNIIYPEDWSKYWLMEYDFYEEYRLIKNYLLDNWFFSYEISNFAKPWYECKHNKAYWNHSEVIAFWLGAYWFVNNTRYARSDNFKDFYNWKKLFEDNLIEEDIFIEKVMFWLRTSWLIEEIYSKLDQKNLLYFLESKYLEKENNIIKITNKGIPILDYIIKELI